MNRAITANEELSVGNGVTLRPADISFAKVFASLSMILAFVYGMNVPFFLIYMGPLPQGWFVTLFSSFLPPLSILLAITPVFIYIRKLEQKWHWAYDNSGVKIYCQNLLVTNLSWAQIRKVVCRKNRVILRLKCHWWQYFDMRGLSNTDCRLIRAAWEECRDSD